MTKKPVTKFNKNILAEKLVIERKRCGLTRDDVIKLSKTGLSRSSLQEWESAKREPKLAYIYDLADIYGVHPWELMSGETIDEIKQPEPTQNDEYVYIPFYDIQASAGIGLFIEGTAQPTKHLAFRRQWVQAKGLRADKLVALYTKGDSMLPTLKDGAIIVINTAKTSPVDGRLYVVRIGKDLLVKRIQKIPMGIRLISDNKSMYDPIDIQYNDYNGNQIQICGQLIHTSYDL